MAVEVEENAGRGAPFSDFAMRRYDLFVLLVPERSEKLWSRDVWLEAVPTLTPLVQSSRGRISVTSMQQPVARPREFTKFGAMTWNERSHTAWTNAPDSGREFRETEVYSPSRLVSYRRAVPPDVYLKIHRPWYPHSAQFDYLVLIATASDQSHPALDPAIQHLCGALAPVVAAATSRTWARPMGENAYGDALDQGFSPLNRVAGNPDATGLELLVPMLVGAWGAKPEQPANWRELTP
ncbi:MAG TPA: hypothetical protein VHZ81_13350 [Galbitalea sp.]|jgi:hypothetical protein|nr:hypothetical protein [Galbitalea sp.]